jgi:hypothetical protein
MPPGCESLKFRPTRSGPGKAYYGKPGGSVDVEPHHADQIANSRNGRLGIISGNPTLALGTRRGRWCVPCRFLAQAWSTECPRCGEPTVEEEPWTGVEPATG